MNDVVLGCYYITRKDWRRRSSFATSRASMKAILAYHFGFVKLQTPIIFNGIETTSAG